MTDDNTLIVYMREHFGDPTHLEMPLPLDLIRLLRPIVEEDQAKPETIQSAQRKELLTMAEKILEADAEIARLTATAARLTEETGAKTEETAAIKARNGESNAKHAEKMAGYEKAGHLFQLSFEGKQITVYNLPTGAEFFSDHIADMFNCSVDDLEHSETNSHRMTMDAVIRHSMKSGPVGTRFRKWLKKTIRLNSMRITPESIKDGLMVYSLKPVRSASGEIVRLKEETCFTQVGYAYLERNLPRRDITTH